MFGYPGTSELALCAAIEALPDGVRLLNARGDKEAVFLAGGASLVSGTPGVAVVHGARGLTNALGAIADLRRSEISLLCVVGMPSRLSAPYLPPHGEIGLLDGAGAFAARAVDCSAFQGFDQGQFVDAVTDAVLTLDRLPLGPVLLGIPEDLLTTRFVAVGRTRHVDGDGPWERGPSVRDAEHLLADARRPLILVDDYFLRAADAEDHLARFAEAIGAPVLQVAYQRGPMLFQQVRPEHVPNYVGRYDPTDLAHQRLLTAVDLLITVEDRNAYPRVVGVLPSCRVVALTSNAVATRKNGYLRDGDVLVEGDACDALRLLTDEWEQPGSRGQRPGADWHVPLTQGDGGWEAEARQATGCSPPAVELVRSLAEALDRVRDPVIVDDSQMLGGLVAENYHLLPASVRVHGSHGGFVGGGLATGAGYAVTDPDAQVLVLLGDHGFSNGLQALATIAEHQAPLVILVADNGTSVSLRKQAEANDLGSQIEQWLGNVPAMDYETIARGFGLTTTRIVWPDSAHLTASVGEASERLSRSIADALAARRPHLVHLVLPSRSPFWAGVWRVRGHEPAAG